VAGPLALVGGDELNPGNEPHDRLLVEAAGDGPAYVLATAAAGQRPDLAVSHARTWFGALGLEVVELPAVRREDVHDPERATLARAGRFFYLVGGDPRLVPATLAGSPLWEAVLAAWRAGAALAGSSAGAMAMAEWTLLPGSGGRRFTEGLGLVPGVAVVPHMDTFGRTWVEGALADRPLDDIVLLGLEERTAAVWQGGRWRAMGAGAVSVIDRGGRREFAGGEAVEGLPAPDRPRLDGGGSRPAQGRGQAPPHDR
jgi:cyanophycinase